MRCLLGRSEERAAGGTRGQRRRAERHGVRLRRWAGHASGHRRGGKAMRPRESPIASPILSDEIHGPVYAARKGHAVRSGTGFCASYDKQELCDSPCLSHNKTYGLYRGELGYWLHSGRYQILSRGRAEAWHSPQVRTWQTSICAYVWRDYAMIRRLLRWCCFW